MTEVEKLFKEIAAYPNLEPVGQSLTYVFGHGDFSYCPVHAGDPAVKFKEFLYGVLTYSVMTFGSDIDFSKIKKEIFG